MADDSNALASYIKSRRVSGEFTPCSYYGPDEDALMFYFRNDPDYAKRINKWLTLYLSMESDELVGCQIKGVARVLEDIGSFGIDVTHKTVKLTIVFLAFLGAASDDPEARDYYRQLGEAASETDSDLEVPELV